MLAIAARPTPESREASSTTLPVAVASPTCRMRFLPLSASQNKKCTNLRMLNAWTDRFRHIHYSSDFSGDMAENWHLTFVRWTVFATKVSIFGICQTLQDDRHIIPDFCECSGRLHRFSCKKFNAISSILTETSFANFARLCLDFCQNSSQIQRFWREWYYRWIL